VILPEGVAAAIIAHAQAAAPEECCGLLLGDAARITAAFPARNVAEDRERRYLVDPRDHLAAIRAARAGHQDVIGAYHSHPHSPARPSATDAAEGFGDFLFVIVGLGGAAPELTAWRWRDGNFTSAPLVRVREGQE
jgi:desampylase